MTRLAFIDTETTGLNPEIQHIWELAVVVEEDGRTILDASWFVRPPSMRLADAQALKIGEFYQRFPNEANGGVVTDSAVVAELLALALADVVIVGNNPGFDVAFLRAFMLEHDQVPTWHYSPVDVKALAAGVLGIAPPWTTDELLKQLDVDVDKLGIERHTARGDVEITRAMYTMVILDRDDLIRAQALSIARV